MRLNDPESNLFSNQLPEGYLRPEMRPGEVCPFCRQGIVDYDGTLTLVCPVCGEKQAGCFT